MELFNTWWAIIRDGLHHIAPIQGLIIGLIFGWMAGSIGSVIFGALGASVVYVAVDTFWPVVFWHKPFVMPVFDMPFWHFQFANIASAIVWAFGLLGAGYYGIKIFM